MQHLSRRRYELLMGALIKAMALLTVAVRWELLVRVFFHAFEMTSCLSDAQERLAATQNKERKLGCVTPTCPI